MKTLFKFYSMALLLMHVVCLRSADSFPFSYETEYPPRDCYSSVSSTCLCTTTTYNLVNCNALEYAQGYGIIELIVCKQFVARKDYISLQYTKDKTSYIVLYDPVDPNAQNDVNNIAWIWQRYKRYQSGLSELPDKLVRYPTLQAAQQAAQQHWSKKLNQQQCLAQEPAMQKCLQVAPSQS